MLIKRGADLPLLLIFSGVIGGAHRVRRDRALGPPVVLAVAYTLSVDWVFQGTPAAQEPPAD